MVLPESDLARIRRWVAAKNEEWAGHTDEVRIEMDVDSRAVTILECRPPWDDPAKSEWIRQEVARLRYTAARTEWALYWPDRHSRFHRYEHVQPTSNVGELLDEIDADRTCIFWG